MSVRYTAFGAMSVSVNGVDVPLQRRRERGVLAVLLAAHGAPVAAERLVAEVWGDEAPAQTLASLQVAVSRLRSQLEPERRARTGTRLVSTAAGYSLVAETAEVDTWSFESLADQALRAVDPDERLRLADEARALWSTTPYADCDAPAVRSETTRLEELRLTVEELRARTLLDLGRPDETLRDLAVLAPQHPYREPMWSLLALAQYQCSRQADALETLRRLRERLADELGVDPSAEIQQLEQAVLRQDAALTAATRTAPAPPSAPAAEPPRSPETSSGTVGRDEIVTHAAAVLRGAVESRSTRFLLVAGEPGIGKSRLATDLGDRARRAGAAVVVGRCHDGDFAPALWPWLGIVRTLVDGLPGGAEPDPLLAPLLEAGVEPDTTGGGTGLRMFDAVVSLIAVAATAQPLLLVLEDIHWADASSLQLLRHLTAAPPQAPVAVLCTRRTTEGTSEGLVDAMAALARAGAERLRLDGLDRDSVRTLLDGSVGAHDPSLDEVVAEITAGNPFFVLQYARLLAALPDLAHVDAAALPVPDGIKDVLRQRTGHLPEEAVRILSSAAVLGHHIDPELVSALTDVPLDQCLDLLDLAMTSGLVEEQDAGYAFVHALARESMYGELSTARRMRLHDRAARLIEQRRGAEADATAEIAHHAHLSAPLGAEHAERACDWLARAAVVATARHAHPEALELWQQVVLDAPPESVIAAEAHQGVGAALLRLARTPEARDAIYRAVRLGQELERWDLVASAAAILNGAGVWSWREHGVMDEPFIAVLTEAVAHVDPAAQARLLATLQMEYYYGWRSDVVEEYGDRSVALARETGDDDLLREVLMLRVVATMGKWSGPSRLALVEELLGRRPRGELEVSALFYLGIVQYECLSVQEADQAMARCAAAAAQLRHSGVDIPLAWWRWARARDADDPAAESLGDAALELHRSSGFIAGGELEALHLIRSAPVGSPVPDRAVELAAAGSAALRAAIGHALLEAGEPERARALLGEPAQAGAADYSTLTGHCLRTAVLSATGTEAEIKASLAEIEPHLGQIAAYGSIDHCGVVDHFVALALAALGDPRALEHARTAVRLNEQLECAPWRRRSEALVARLS